MWNCEYQTKKMEACAQVGDVELVMTKSEVRFCVSPSLWDIGLSIEKAFAQMSASASPLSTGENQ
jgi:hypothetical protein